MNPFLDVFSAGNRDMTPYGAVNPFAAEQPQMPDPRLVALGAQAVAAMSGQQGQFPHGQPLGGFLSNQIQPDLSWMAQPAAVGPSLPAIHPPPSRIHPASHPSYGQPSYAPPAPLPSRRNQAPSATQGYGNYPQPPGGGSPSGGPPGDVVGAPPVGGQQGTPGGAAPRGPGNGGGQPSYAPPAPSSTPAGVALPPTGPNVSTQQEQQGGVDWMKILAGTAGGGGGYLLYQALRNKAQGKPMFTPNPNAPAAPSAGGGPATQRLSPQGGRTQRLPAQQGGRTQRLGPGGGRTQRLGPDSETRVMESGPARTQRLGPDTPTRVAPKGGGPTQRLSPVTEPPVNPGLVQSRNAGPGGTQRLNRSRMGGGTQRLSGPPMPEGYVPRPSVDPAAAYRAPYGGNNPANYDWDPVRGSGIPMQEGMMSAPQRVGPQYPVRSGARSPVFEEALPYRIANEASPLNGLPRGMRLYGNTALPLGLTALSLAQDYAANQLVNSAMMHNLEQAGAKAEMANQMLKHAASQGRGATTLNQQERHQLADIAGKGSTWFGDPNHPVSPWVLPQPQAPSPLRQTFQPTSRPKAKKKPVKK